jgi:hypothetical protein
MPGFIIRTGDMLQVMIPPPAIVPQLQAPVPLRGSGTSLIVDGTPACLLGDELPAVLREPLAYTAPPFTIPGTGTLTLTLLPGNQTTELTRTSGQPILIKGQPFTAMFTVLTPAMMSTPGGPVPDPERAKTGTAEFITTNAAVQAS